MSVNDIEKADDQANYIITMQELARDKNEIPDFSSKGESFWRKDCPADIFKAHPSAPEGILYKPY